jgi:type III pantothenate kinase
MNVLIDIGNTRIKWCVEENGRLSKAQAIEYKQADITTEIQYHWFKLDTPNFLAVSSVGAKHVSKQIIEIAKKIWPKINVFVAKSSVCCCSVTNAYQQPEKLGIDRWLGLIALHHYYPGNSCIVDCGTAITIDLIDEQGQHLGGVISPGLQLMRQSLCQGAEDLLSISILQDDSQGLSNNTESAIYAGTLYAVAGLIEKVKNDCHLDGTIVLTGGDAKLLTEYLDFKLIVDPDFVLKGLSLFYQQEMG